MFETDVKLAPDNDELMANLVSSFSVIQGYVSSEIELQTALLLALSTFFPDSDQPYFPSLIFLILLNITF